MATTKQFDPLIAKYSVVYGVPFAWIKAIMGTESSFDPRAFRAEPQINDASRGLMQVLLRTARSLGFTGDPEELFDPERSIQLGAKLIADNGFMDSFERTYSAYNSGRPDNYLTNPTVAENVRRAVRWLDRINSEIGDGTVVALPPTQAGAGVVLLVILGALILGK